MLRVGRKFTLYFFNATKHKTLIPYTLLTLTTRVILTVAFGTTALLGIHEIRERRVIIHNPNSLVNYLRSIV